MFHRFTLVRSALARSAAVATALTLAACGSQEAAPDKPAPKPATPERAAAVPEKAAPASGLPAGTSPDSLPQGLLLALASFEGGAPASELVMLVREGGAWTPSVVADDESNVFHKAMVYETPGVEPGILTLGGSAAAVKLWRKGDEGLAPIETLWMKDFGGKFSRMRDAEIADIYGDGTTAIAVATHDQGVMAVIRPGAEGFEVEELATAPMPWIHEVEIGDLDGDGVLEVYATPSNPNRLDGSHQEGTVVRYVPAKGVGPEPVADLGKRHAKEILVEDVDGDGRDELYVSIEAAEGGDLEVRRYDAGDAPDSGVAIATLRDPMARFLTAGDGDGDGKKELVVAAKDSGVWLLRPGADPRGTWEATLLDKESGGFEHASIFTDLDGDGVDELYVASDTHGELRRYVWVDGAPTREVIYSRPPKKFFTWNLMPVDRALLP
ncbi:MAG: FG-GAP-like repeat-containing protein [Myxococcota bacterium]|nr:FG-GAP-like repeat-containing protein [Myxococcota bacterium]